MSQRGELRIPALAGICTLDESQRAGFGVAEAARRLRRFSFVAERLVHIAAAHLNSTPEWEVKSALALHSWVDAQHANWLRERVLELREPTAKLDEIPDAKLEAALEETLRSQGTAELITAIYVALRPALCEATEKYLVETNPLADQPTCRILRLISFEQRESIEWGMGALEALLSDDVVRTQCQKWAAHVRGYLTAAGGVDGTELIVNEKLPASRATKRFVPQVLPKRDSRFGGLFDTSTPADTVYLDESRPVDERNVALMFKRLREMDVPEVVASVMAETPGKPWPYYADMARQMWDEARHALLGEAALSRKFEGRAVDWTKLPVNVTFSYKLAKFCKPIERHILLYAIEQSLMPAKKGKKYEWELAKKAGDPLMKTFQDFDWADEVLHVSIARRQLRPDLKGGLDEARRRSDKLWSKIEKQLERNPMPDDAPDADWWERLVEGVTGKKAGPVPETHVKDWRPVSA
ncbi:MAG: hypothetical protein HY046_05640 [Acidobacteria bacterium]|nr:hypothetical protein [Acidobacteriota bacterium]